MAVLPTPFDATQHEPNTGPPPPLPDDWYNCHLTDSDVKLTKRGKPVGSSPEAQGTDEWLLELTFKVLDGHYAGRLIWDRLNLGNANATAVDIANGDLTAICHAVGIFQIHDVSVLHGHPLMVRAKEKPPKDGYDAGNDVGGYAKVGEKDSKNARGEILQPVHGGGARTSAPAAPAAVPGAPTFTPPWQQAETPAAAEVPVVPAATAAPTPMPAAAPAPVPAAPLTAAPAVPAGAHIPSPVAPGVATMPAPGAPPPVTVTPAPPAVAPPPVAAPAQAAQPAPPWGTPPAVPPVG